MVDIRNGIRRIVLSGLVLVLASCANKTQIVNYGSLDKPLEIRVTTIKNQIIGEFSGDGLIDFLVKQGINREIGTFLMQKGVKIVLSDGSEVQEINQYGGVLRSHGVYNEGTNQLILPVQEPKNPVIDDSELVPSTCSLRAHLFHEVGHALFDDVGGDSLFDSFDYSGPSREAIVSRIKKIQTGMRGYSCEPCVSEDFANLFGAFMLKTDKDIEIYQIFTKMRYKGKSLKDSE